jgi:hypothetical protein
MPANESPKKSMDTPGIDYSLVMNTWDLTKSTKPQMYTWTKNCKENFGLKIIVDCAIW